MLHRGGTVGPTCSYCPPMETNHNSLNNMIREYIYSIWFCCSDLFSCCTACQMNGCVKMLLASLSVLGVILFRPCIHTGMESVSYSTYVIILWSVMHKLLSLTVDEDPQKMSYLPEQWRPHCRQDPTGRCGPCRSWQAPSDLATPPHSWWLPAWFLPEWSGPAEETKSVISSWISSMNRWSTIQLTYSVCAHARTRSILTM